MQAPPTITAIILAGGQSQRMGTEKGLVPFRGRPLIASVLEVAKKVADEILLVTANPAYERFGYPLIEEEFRGKGPLSGICSGLSYSSSAKNLVLGCDMPFLNVRLLAELQASAGAEQVLLTQHKGLPEPLCSVYDRSCVAHIRTLLEQNQLKITDALAGLKTRLISFDGKDWFRGNEFTNLNSPEELEKYSL